MWEVDLPLGPSLGSVSSGVKRIKAFIFYVKNLSITKFEVFNIMIAKIFKPRISLLQGGGGAGRELCN